MRKALAPLAVGAVLLFAAGTASADVFGRAIVRVTKDVLIFETINVTKNVTIFGDVVVEAVKAAESLAVVNQENSHNEACENCAEKRDHIINSIGGTNANPNNGITTVNQASGNNTNQGTAIAVAIDNGKPPTDPPTDPPQQVPGTGFAEAQAAGEQRNNDNFVDSISIIFRDALILDSINGNVGITAVNQATGNMINQANIVSLALSLESGVALSEALLGQDNRNNTNLEADINKNATITGSIHGNMGITQVNQSVGNLSNQANAVAVAATISGL
jgi:hypothetical protein